MTYSISIVSRMSVPDTLQFSGQNEVRVLALNFVE